MFRLSRYFSIASLVGFIAALIAVAWVYQSIATANLVEHRTDTNVALARSLANTVWNQHADFIKGASRIAPSDLPLHPVVHAIDSEVRQQMHGQKIVKVKIYNLNGLTVFSTEPKQIGRDKSGSQGFITASRGTTVSEITFRNQFYGLERVIVDRNIVSSYIPIRHKESGEVEAVFELYSDVTEFAEQLKETQYKVVGTVLVAFGLLYCFLYLIVRHADNILLRHDEQRRAIEAKIRHQAYHDSLTGLANRLGFQDRLQEALYRSLRTGKDMALMFVDLDRFKLVNDSLGHNAGDRLLREASDRLNNAIRDCDLLFRMGGDEFTIIAEGLDKNTSASIIAERIVMAMSRPFLLEGRELFVTTSIGIATSPSDSEQVEELVKKADAAMYRAKQLGGNRFEFYQEEMGSAALQRLDMESALQRALENHEFELYYQAKVGARDGRIVGMEALLRWRRNEDTMIPPNEFIPFLEASGMIIPVGRWVMQEAASQMQRWIGQGLPAHRVSVNISARQFQNANFVQSVADTLSSTELPPQYLELELTESTFLDQTEEAITRMHQLKQLGVAISIDDFGTGYSSLSYLKRFPVDVLKVDRSFVMDIENDEKDRAITSSIASLAASLNLGLIAEGVETPQQVDILLSQGYEAMQGFLYAKPMPANTFETLLREGGVQVSIPEQVKRA